MTVPRGLRRMRVRAIEADGRQPTGADEHRSVSDYRRIVSRSLSTRR